MKPTGNIKWKCIACNLEVDYLHEIFYGTFQKPMSVEYNLQIPACKRHHDVFHSVVKPNQFTVAEIKIFPTNPEKPDLQDWLCEKMLLPARHLINRALNIGDKKYLSILKLIGELSLQSMEV